MKLGIIAYPNEDGFKMAANRGLEFIEYCINVGENSDALLKNQDAIKGWIDKYNVKIGSIGRWGQDRIDKEGNIIEEELEVCYQIIDAASYIGCDNLNVGCNYVEEFSYFDNCRFAIDFLSKLIDYAKDKNVRISTYNCRWNNFIYDNTAWSIVHAHLKDLGIKYDTSHCIYDGGDYMTESKDWGNRFNHVHIKGALVINGERFDDPPAGMDQTNWGAFMAVLYAKGYDRGLSIEPHSSTWSGELGQKGIDFTINYIKQFMF